MRTTQKMFVRLLGVQIIDVLQQHFLGDGRWEDAEDGVDEGHVGINN